MIKSGGYRFRAVRTKVISAGWPHHGNLWFSNWTGPFSRRIQNRAHILDSAVAILMANCINIICRFHRAALYVDKYPQQAVSLARSDRSFVTTVLIQYNRPKYVALPPHNSYGSVRGSESRECVEPCAVKEKRCVNFEMREKEREKKEKTKEIRREAVGLGCTQSRHFLPSRIT